jgi:hypothetical protein
LIGNLDKYDYRYFISLHQSPYDLYEKSIMPYEYNIEFIKENTIKNLQEKFISKRPIYGIYYICCIGNYLNIINEQINTLIISGLYEISDQILCFVCNVKNDCLDILKKYDKIKIIQTNENLYEKFAINQYKEYLKGEYYLFYIHTKSVSRKEICYINWRNLCDYFTIYKWRLNIELLNYYDCIGINLKNFPKKHYSGNFWWSKSEHLDRLLDINDSYLSPEMYICSYSKTNYVSLYQSYINHGDTEYPNYLYNNISDIDLIQNICFIPDFNPGDKKCINMCGNNSFNEHSIIEFN